MNDTNSFAQVKWKGNTISHLHHISESYTGKADVRLRLGVFGEETVNVLKVNLMLDGILQ